MLETLRSHVTKLRSCTHRLWWGRDSCECRHGRCSTSQGFCCRPSFDDWSPKDRCERSRRHCMEMSQLQKCLVVVVVDTIFIATTAACCWVGEGQTNLISWICVWFTWDPLRTFLQKWLRSRCEFAAANRIANGIIVSWIVVSSWPTFLLFSQSSYWYVLLSHFGQVITTSKNLNLDSLRMRKK